MPPGSSGALSLAPAAPALRALLLSGAGVGLLRALLLSSAGVGLLFALSLADLSRLTRLELPGAPEPVTTEALIAAVRGAPRLAELALRDLRLCNSAGRGPGDDLLQQAGCACRRLARLDLRDER